MGYGQWVGITIQAEGMNLSIKDAGCANGKFHKKDNKDAEVSADEIKKITISNGA